MLYTQRISTRLFADDTDVFLANKDYVKVLEMVFENLSQMDIGLSQNKLTLRIGKKTLTRSFMLINIITMHACPESISF